MIIAVTGLFFLRKDNWKLYLLSGVIAIVIFLPHISISLHQFSMGGVGQWLSKPGKDFLWKYILYGLNDSPLVVITISVLVMLSVLIYHLDITFSPEGLFRIKFQIICIAWFIIPFLAGYYYSVYINPVLQYSTLLFSFPFLILFLFSFFKERKEKFNNISLGSLGLVLLFSTIAEKKFYKQEYFGVFKEINNTIINLQEKYGKENTTIFLNTSQKEIFDFYFKEKNKSVSFYFQAGDDSSFISDILKKVDECSTPYFISGIS